MLRAISALAVAGVLGVGIAVIAGAATFTESFTGSPATPIAFTSENWDITYSAVGHGEIGEPTVASGQQVQHGPDCGAPGDDGSVRHVAATFADHVFQCRDHIMTYPPNGTSGTRLVPNQLLDLSSGEATVRFDVSTLSLSTRDWLEVWVQDWNSQEQKIIESQTPSAQGDPRNAIMVQQGVDGFESGSGRWNVRTFDGNRNTSAHLRGGSIDEVVPQRSAQSRETFELVINRTAGTIKFWMPARNFVITEGPIPPFAWDRGIVTFLHNAYNPEKGTNPLTGAGSGEANTWHWDNVTISPALPFTIVKTDHRGSDTAPVDTWTFARPLPAGAVVRFEAFSDDSPGAVRVRFDNGAWQAPTKMSLHAHPENAASYLVAGPQGATRITIEVVAAAFGFVRDVNNVSAFALDGGVPSTPTTTPAPTTPPTPTPVLTPTPTPVASPSPTSTPTPTATPLPTATPPAVNVRCEVLGGNQYLCTVLP